MKKLIQSKLKEIEQRYKVKILFAVEAGSRVWGMESKDSDYDVRFVFAHPVKEYLKINGNNEVIHEAYDKEGKSVPVEGAYLDFVGFDVRKFARLLYSSNPSAIEWLISDINYYGEKPKVFVDFAVNRFKPISLYYHYKSMGKQNYLKYIKSGDKVTYKKYLYAMRGIINAKWVARYNTVPNIDFFSTILTICGEDTANDVPIKDELIPVEISEKLANIIDLKRKSDEKDIVENIVEIDEYIENYLADDSDAPTNKQLSIARELDEEVLKILGV